MTRDGKWKDPLDGIRLAVMDWKDIVKVRATRWEMTVDMKEFEEDNERVKGLSEKWERRWTEMEDEDGKGLRESEKDMLRFFSKRGILELDKRCWLINTGKARMCDKRQYRFLKIRQVVRTAWNGNERKQENVVSTDRLEKTRGRTRGTP